MIPPRLCRRRFQSTHWSMKPTHAQHRSLSSASHARCTLHSDFVVVCQRLKLYCAQSNGFTCQPLRGLAHARGIITARTFSHGEKNLTHKKLQPSAYCRRLSNSKKIIKKIRKKQSIVIFFSILNIQKLEMSVWHFKSRTK